MARIDAKLEVRAAGRLILDRAYEIREDDPSPLDDDAVRARVMLEHPFLAAPIEAPTPGQVRARFIRDYGRLLDEATPDQETIDAAMQYAASQLVTEATAERANEIDQLMAPVRAVMFEEHRVAIIAERKRRIEELRAQVLADLGALVVTGDEGH